MKLFIKIPKGLKHHFDAELELSRREFKKGHLRQSWTHLERAHILGQAWHMEYTRAHVKMLRFAIRIKDLKEIIGQMPRLLFGGINHL